MHDVECACIQHWLRHIFFIPADLCNQIVHVSNVLMYMIGIFRCEQRCATYVCTSLLQEYRMFTFKTQPRIVIHNNLIASSNGRKEVANEIKFSSEGII